MRKSRFTDEKMVSILRETDRDSVAAVAKRHGISEQTIYGWKKRFGTFDANDVRRLKQLELENAKLKKLLAERDLELDEPRKRRAAYPFGHFCCEEFRLACSERGKR